MNVNELLTVLISYSAVAIAVIGALAFAVGIITQVTKGFGFLNVIPTAIQVYVVSLILTVLTVMIYIQIMNMLFVWYYIVGAIILSFFVSFVAIYGWSQFHEMWNRFNDKGETK